MEEMTNEQLQIAINDAFKSLAAMMSTCPGPERDHPLYDDMIKHCNVLLGVQRMRAVGMVNVDMV